MNAEKHRRLKKESEINVTKKILAEANRNEKINSKANKNGFSEVATSKKDLLVPNVKFKH